MSYIWTQTHYHDIQQFVSEKPMYQNNALQIYGSKDDSELSKFFLDKAHFFKKFLQTLTSNFLRHP